MKLLAISKGLQLTMVAFALLVTSTFSCVFGQIPVSRGGRILAPDAMEVIEPAAEWGETAQGPIDLPLVARNPQLDWVPSEYPKSDTLLSKAQGIVFRNDIYSLQFAFKPVRMINVDGQIVWYMVYRVRYKGGDLRPKAEPDQFNNEIFGKPKSVSAQWIRFMPTFKLDTLRLGDVHMDRSIPGARAAIAAKERVGKQLFDSISIQRVKIELTTPTRDNSVWGVATWTGVDPRTDFFTVQVQGLTNAQKLVTNGDKITYLQKTLVLHFSRPGDTVDELEDRIRFGIPALADPARQKYVLSQYGQQERLDYVWTYR